MFISVKRHEREKQELLGASNRLTDAILKSSAQGLFLIDAKAKVLPQVSASLGTMFRRQEFANLTFEKLLAPLVTAKTLSAARGFLTRLLDAGTANDAEQSRPLQDVEVRPVDSPGEPRAWLVRVTDITARVQQQRELEDLRNHKQTQGEILRSVL